MNVAVDDGEAWHLCFPQGVIRLVQDGQNSRLMLRGFRWKTILYVARL